MEKGGSWLEASSEVLKDHVHAVKFYLFDGLPEPPRKIPYGLVFMLQNSLQGTNVSFLAQRAQVLRDKCSIKFIERVY